MAIHKNDVEGFDMSTNKPIAAGREAEIFAYAEGKVLKLFFPQYPTHDAHNEADLTRMVSDAGVSTPRVYEVIEQGNRAGIIFERINGKTLMEALMGDVFKVRHYGRMMADCHVNVHQYSNTDLLSQREALINRINYAPHITDTIKQRVLRLLDTLPDDNRICHMDFHGDNIMVDGNRLVVIDWVNAKRGHPLADVARTLVMLQYGVTPDAGRIEQFVINRMRQRFINGYLAQYCKVQSVHYDDIKAWIPPVATARLCEEIESDVKILPSVIETTLNELGLLNV